MVSAPSFRPSFIRSVIFFIAGILLCGATDAFAASAVRVAVSTLHTCVITSQGGVKCWGRNRFGELGDGTTNGRYTAVDVRGLGRGVIAIATGEEFSCALTAAGVVKCWGWNYRGSLGDGTTEDRHEPADVVGLSGVVAISAGSAHACALTGSGTVKCWGDNTSGQLGDGTTTNRLTPVDVAGLSGVTSVSAGGASSCALTANGGVKCWGAKASCDYPYCRNSGTPVDVRGLTNGVRQVSVGGAHACALLSTGIKCWGSNSAGQLGNGKSTDYGDSAAVDVTGLTTGIAAISAGSASSCALMESGLVKCWGAIPGSGLSATSSVPVDLTGLTAKVASIAAGSHSCAVTVGGAVKCWGLGFSSVEGEGVPGAYTPAAVIGLYSGVRSIAAAGDMSCATTAGGALRCWGWNYAGGSSRIGSTTGYPATVTGFETGATAVALGYSIMNTSHGCAIASGGALRCWGDNSKGQLGDGTTTGRTTPVSVTGLTTGVSAVSAGTEFTCALTTSGGVKCWGSNNLGQLGDGTFTNGTTPVEVIGLSSGVVAIASGLGHTCALTNRGSVTCWGNNSSGQLGNGASTYQQPVPVDVVGLSSGVSSIAAGAGHTCAAMTAGGVKCWGSNAYGQLGAASLPASIWSIQTVPIDVTGVTAGVADLSAGYKHTCAVMSGGGVKCWGYNAYGQLGDGVPEDTYTLPIDVPAAGTNVIAIASGEYHNCALTTAGGVECWGFNIYGQIGDATVVLDGAIVTAPGFGGIVDFNDDGQPDIVSREIDPNDLLFWLMNGTTVGSRQSVPATYDRNWQIAAVADFDADGRADIAWHNAVTGANDIRYMAGTTPADSLKIVPPTGGNWRIVAGADLNADGKTDVIWRDPSTGANLVSVLDGSLVIGELSIETWTDPNWTIVAAADFNGDDQPDLLWRNTATGENRVWFMNRSLHTGSASIETLPNAHWTVAGTADFNGDGSADIVWRNTATGETSLWLMAKTSHIGTVALPTTEVPTSKRPRGNGPTVGQAMPRPMTSLQQPSAGQTQAGFERAPSGTAESTLAVVEPARAKHVWLEIHRGDRMTGAGSDNSGWEIVATADIDGDGEADAIARNETTGENEIWFLRNGACDRYSELPTLIGEQWEIAATIDYDDDGTPDLFWWNQATRETLVWFLNPARQLFGAEPPLGRPLSTRSPAASRCARSRSRR